MSVQAFEFLVFAAAQVGTPGPANMTLLATGARFGLRPALPFVGGVILGKQLIIWPIGFGVMALLGAHPLVFATAIPGFFAGLWVHPLNPKAWAMIIAGFTSFVEPATPLLTATFVVALTLLAVQTVLHPMWCLGGEWLARRLVGSRHERTLMVTLAALTVASIIYVLILGGR
jgi:threonine/homoserine/homoserine lactone efflux protein